LCSTAKIQALHVLAYVEELLWDSAVWHERPWLSREWLSGENWQIGNLEIVLVPLLAVPQLTHYLLDGFIWKRRSNARFSSMLNENPVKKEA
jgi:hypothetical protein